MIKITEIAFTGYPTTNIPRARKFYEGVLKLEKTVHLKDGGKSWIEYDIGPGTLAISDLYTDTWKSSPDGPMIALEVQNFDEAVAAIKRRKVPIVEGPTDNGSCDTVVISDPDGNALKLHKRKPAAK